MCVQLRVLGSCSSPTPGLENPGYPGFILVVLTHRDAFCSMGFDASRSRSVPSISKYSNFVRLGDVAGWAPRNSRRSVRTGCWPAEAVAASRILATTGPAWSVLIVAARGKYPRDEREQMLALIDFNYLDCRISSMDRCSGLTTRSLKDRAGVGGIEDGRVRRHVRASAWLPAGLGCGRWRSRRRRAGRRARSDRR